MNFYNQPYSQQPDYTANNMFFGKGVSPVDNGCVWFVAFAPLFALYIENTGSSKLASAFLWIFTYLLCVFVCKYDKDKVLNRFFDSTALKASYLVPVIYLTQRNKLTRQKGMFSLVCVITTCFALIGNGFVRYATLTADDYIVTVQKYPASNIENFEEFDTISNNQITECIQSFVKHDSIVWTCDMADKVSTVTAVCDFDNNGKTSSLKIVFEMEYDGFMFGGIKVSGLEIDGKELSEEDEKAFLMRVFSDKPKKGVSNSITDENLVEA